MSRRTFLSFAAARGALPRALRLGASAALCGGLLGAAALAGTAGVAAASAPAALYAYAAGTAPSPTACPKTATSGDECTLGAALGLAAAGDTVLLVTGANAASSEFIGNFAIAPDTTPATEPITIETAPGSPTQAVLDGNQGGSTGCTTSACNGPILTVGKNVDLAIVDVLFEDADNTATDQGGAIVSDGELSVADSQFLDNVANGDGGAIDSGDGAGMSGSLVVTGSTFVGNDVNTNSDGGAIDSGDWGAAGTLTVTDSAFSDNSTEGAGGAIDSAGNGSKASASVTGSSFSDNRSDGDGGAIDSGDGSQGQLEVADSTFDGNASQDTGGAIDSSDGGGIGTATITSSSFAGDSAEGAGAIGSGNFSGSGKLTVSDSSFTGDLAFVVGGGLLIGYGDGSGTATISDDAFFSDSAGEDAGGAIALDTPDKVLASDSTFSQDSAPYGGAIASMDGGPVDVASSTFDDDVAPLGGGGAVATSGGPFDLAADVLAGAQGDECLGTVVDGGYNVSDDATCGFAGHHSVSSSTALDGYLGAYSNNGGPTWTVPLLAASTASPATKDPALGLVPTTFKAPGSTKAVCSTPDERGIDRTGPCDAGAFELAPSKTTLKLSSSKVTLGAEQSEHLTVAVTPIVAGLPPTGKVVVSAGTKRLCTVTLAAGSGGCKLGASQLAAGSYRLTASYGGDTNVAASASDSEALTVAK